MPASRKLIKSRIKSVKNTRKITKAMELVAASKMRKAVAATLKGRLYVRLARETIEAVTIKSVNSIHELLQPGRGTRELAIVFTSDRGLAGGYNVNMVKFVREMVKETGKGDVDVIAVGKRGSDALQRLNVHVIASFTGFGNAPQYSDIVPVARMAIDGFTGGTYRRVRLFYTDFVSGVTQIPTAQVVLPYGEHAHADQDMGHPCAGGDPGSSNMEAQRIEYTLEPNAHELLSQMIPRLVMTAFYQALLESSASEHAARMLAMKNASDSARDMMDALTFTYNQVRQAGITQEIAEISSGAAALS